MSRTTTQILKAALSAMHYSGVDNFAAPMMRGRGVIFMLHHVTPDVPRDFEPNGILKISPDFLDDVLQLVRAAGFNIISLDDVPARLTASDTCKPFAVFTLDDGYKDNRDFAYPVFKRHGAPFGIYIPADYADGVGNLWWIVLEEALRRLPYVTAQMDGEEQDFTLQTADEKSIAFDRIYWWLRRMPERQARSVVETLARQAEIDIGAMCRALVMSWNEIRILAKDPLVTIGAHTRSHYALAKLPIEQAQAEILESVARVSQELGRPCRHFSYPYGCDISAGPREFDIARDAGLATAVTTRKGLIQNHHRDRITALPRLSLNGDFQDVRYVKVLLSGLPFALFDAARLVTKPLSALSAA